MKKSHKILFLIGRPLAPLYSLVMIIRSYLYRKSVFRRTRLPVSVVSVGNLTMGGTGKTPLVLYVARLLAGKFRPAIVSRGYGGKASGEVNVVSDGEKIYLDATEAGDEPLLLAQSLPGIPVVTGTKRATVGHYAVSSLQADLVIMDDGFQHMALCRDLDLVLFSASVLLGNRVVFPGGTLREPYSALCRADAFVITGVNELNAGGVQAFQQELASCFPGVPIFTGHYKVTGVSRMAAGDKIAISEIREVPLLAFCGIATPASFFNTLAEEGLEVHETLVFEDHHPFSASDVSLIEKTAREKGCRGLIVTMKDFVKIVQLEFEIPLWVLMVELEMSEGFDEYILAEVARGNG